MVWMSHGVRGDFVDYEQKRLVQQQPNWSFSVFPTGAMPHFEEPAEFTLFIGQDDHVAVLGRLIETLGNRPVFLAGISFGGIIALRYAIEHGDTLAGLVPMSTFAELPPQLALLGNAMRTGLILGGTGYLQDMLLPMNLSDAWLAPLMDKLDTVKRQGWLVNDVYALQNLMESFLHFEPLTPQLHQILSLR